MNIGIIGLGLIGGSLAKAFKKHTQHTVLGFDNSQQVIYKAQLLNAIDEPLTNDRLQVCDIVIVALYPEDTVKYVEDHHIYFKKEAIVMDVSGIKVDVCDKLMPLAEKNDFIFIGTHPMAGIEYSGFDNSQKELFENASIVITPPKDVDILLLEKIKKLWGSINFTNVVISTAKKHDEIIAYTSQLAHIVSNAYVKSPTALEQSGFSAGSYKDMTRVARLNERMWAELFLANKNNLISQIQILISNLKAYEDALKSDDFNLLLDLLRDGHEKKCLADRKDLK